MPQQIFVGLVEECICQVEIGSIMHNKPETANIHGTAHTPSSCLFNLRIGQYLS